MVTHISTILYICLFFKISRPALGLNQPPVQWVLGVLSLGIKWLECEADHLPLSSAEVSMSGAILPLTQYAFMACIGTTLPFLLLQLLIYQNYFPTSVRKDRCGVTMTIYPACPFLNQVIDFKETWMNIIQLEASFTLYFKFLIYYHQ